MRVKFGMMLPIPNAESMDSVIRAGKRIEEHDFDSIWIPDHTLMLPLGLVPEAWITLTAIGMITSKTLLGSCVSDIHRYNPAIFAQKLATISQITKGRIILGLGTGEAMNLEPFGFKDWKVNRLEKLREFVSLIRKFLNGEIITFKSKFYNFENAFIQIKPYTKIPIYIGANARKSREICGEIGDGWIPAVESPELIKKHLQDIVRGLEKSNRTLNEFDVCIWTYTAISDNKQEIEKVLDIAKPLIGSNVEKLYEEGFDIRLPEKYSKKYYFEKVLVNEQGIKDFYELSKYIPNDVVYKVCIIGTLREVIDKIEQYIKAGVKHFILINLGPKPLEVLKIYKEKIIPVFKQ